MVAEPPVDDRSFTCMGTTCRVIAADAAGAERFLHAAAAVLTRFAPSGLTALNADPRATVPVSPVLAAAVGAALWAAERTGGLVDPCVLPDLERAGYAATRAGAPAAPLAAALAEAPGRGSAGPSGRWRAVSVADGAVTRPPGVRLDLGGTAKGLLADAVVHRLGGDVLVDLGGDLRTTRPRDVLVAHPRGGTAATLAVEHAVATSSIAQRSWWTGHEPAHHLLDPATGRPAWTGLVQATALAPTALEAEALAKAALLAGPGRAARWLPHGGVLVADDGAVREIRA